MIKLFTQDLFNNNFGGHIEESFSEDKNPEADYLSPSDETIAKLKNFARSFTTVDLSMDPKYTFPTA